MNSQAFTEAPVLAALIAAFSALVIAMLQLVTQRRQMRTIETLKARLVNQNTAYSEHLKAYLKLQLDGETQEIQAFRQMLEAAQLVKDKVRLLHDHAEPFPDSDLTRDNLHRLQKQIIEIFAHVYTAFSRQHFECAHQLKNTCLDMTCPPSLVQG